MPGITMLAADTFLASLTEIGLCQKSAVVVTTIYSYQDAGLLCEHEKIRSR